MGIFRDFFGLLLGGAYVSKNLISEINAKDEYKRKTESFEQSFQEINTFLTDYELDRLIGDFVSKKKNDVRIREMLSNEFSYIADGDDKVILGIKSDAIRDLLMSKFGKLSGNTLAGCSHFGNFTTIGNSIDSYEVSKRVMQCIESNILNATGRGILFGVDTSAPFTHCYNGKYPSAPVAIAGMTMQGITRIYCSVSIPYTPISKELLLDG